MPRQSATTTATPPPRASRLKIALVERGVTQCELAKRLRISPSRMNRLVHGRQQPTDDEQDQLAEILEQPRRKLFRVTA